MNLSQMRYYRKNREEILKKSRQHYEKNRDMLIEKSRKYRQENAGKLKEYRLKNRERRLEQLRKWAKKNPLYNRKRYLENRKYIINYKLSKGCSVCGYNKYASALDFHHNNGNKEFSISQFNTHSLKRIKIEIDKCKVLCRNCHAELHEKEGKYESRHRSTIPFQRI